MPLNLVARKSLRDNEEHLNKAHEEIKNALNGEEWIIEFDWDVIFDKVDEHVKKQLGEVFYKNLCPNISKCIVNASKDELTKESIINANTAKKIVLVVNEDAKNSSYWKYEFNGGQLNLLFKKGCNNITEAGNFELYKVIPSEGVFSLAARLNMKENQEKFDTAFERIKAATHMDWSYEQESLEQIYPALEERNKERIGDLFSDIFKYVADNIEKKCKNDTILEAFVEATSNAKIVFRHNAKASGYWNWTFEGGNLIITFKSICNISDNANFDFIKVLPVPGVFSLAAKINLKENQEKFDTAFERIKEVTKVDWSYDEQSLETVYPALEERNKERIGDLFQEIIKYVADNIVKHCKEDIVLESFLEATSNAKIVFRHNAKANGYWNWSFENNDLVITFKSICNVSDNANFDFIKILPSPGVLTLASRINLRENQEKINESFEKIKEVLGNDWTYDESSLEQVYPKLEENNKPRVGDVFAEVIRYIGQNIVKRCKDDDMVKEGFVEATQNCKIVFQFVEKQSSYWVWKFDGGNLVVSFKSICNTSDNANFNFEALL
ncbi:hypothetical protein ACTFIR_009158 [Dictyostelium discoideum]